MNLFKIYSKISQFFWTSLNKKIVGSSGELLKINKKTLLSGNTFLGNNCHFNGMRVFGKGKVTIGDNFHSGSNCKIYTQNHNYQGEEIPYDSTYIVKDTYIGNNVWMGDSVTIIPGIHIEEGSIIGVGSVITKNVPYGAIVGGNPAKVIKYRDMKKYERLKQEKKYH